MTALAPPSIDFRASTRHVPPNIPAAVQRATARLLASRAAAAAQVPEWEALRQAAHDLRLDGIIHLDDHVAQAERAVRAAGGHVHHARDAAEANAIVVELARRHRVRTAVKGKSMATEEIGLNAALEQAGVRAVETDIGEFIIQLTGERPSHILGPTLHMSKEEIAATFTEKLGVTAPPEPRALVEIARSQLRQEFLRAEMGITGGNFVVAETGTLVLLTNEGNGRLCTTLPDVHVAVVGIEKVIPDWDSLAILLRLLARSATGQKMACHTSFITGPRRTAGENGPREFHLILLDNGRSRIRQDPATRETLLCIRCAACLNVCPVYNQVGGHAYGWVYSGPLGAILSPQLLGMKVARDLPFASTLCGACADICPVRVPIPRILLHLRRRVAEGDAAEHVTAAPAVRVSAKLTARVLGTPRLYRAGARVLELVQVPFRRGNWLPSLPPPLNRWTQTRPLPAMNSRFRGWWRRRVIAAAGGPAGGPSPETAQPAVAGSSEPAPSQVGAASQPSRTATDEMDTLLAEINRLSGKAQRISDQEVDAALRDMVECEGVKKAALCLTNGIARLNLAARLRALGVEMVPCDADKTTLAQTDLGVTGVDFAFAESGTLGLLSSPEKPRAVSILPRVQLLIVRPEVLRSDLAALSAQAKTERYLVFITGLSRTSDIESNPVLGAHGPQALYVWAMEN